MPFTSIHFAAFFLAVLIAYWSLRPWRTGQKLLLLLASAWFYGSWNVRFLALLAAAAVLGFAGGEIVARTRGRVRTAALWITIAGFLAILGVLKYYDFFRVNLEDLAALAGLTSHLPLLHLVFPVGISFYTFQGISYVVDVHRGEGTRARSLLDFLLYMAFFPKLIAGPICRARELLPQIEAPAPKGIPDISLAISLLASGVFKKVVIATYLQTGLVDSAFAAPESHSSLELLLGLYAYTMQVYADFSGYTDIALACGLFLGFRLPPNFEAPYAATSIGEFWRRWHMSFSRWLRDYVYFPLGGSREGRLRTYANLFLTFALGGLWHGARWGFLVWGAIHGLALIVQKVWLDVRRARGVAVDAPAPVAWVAVSWLLTFHVCVFARLFFRAGDLEPARRYFESLLAFRTLGEGIDPMVLGLCALVLWMNFGGRRLREWFVASHERTPAIARPVAWLALTALVLALRPGGVPPYIYAGF